MPASARFAFSSELGWALEHREIQEALARSPQVGQMLDLFLLKARIDPSKDKGRLTLYLLDFPANTAKPQDFTGAILLHLSGFGDAAALQHAVTESFPAEGFLRAQDMDWPLFVVMDLQRGDTQIHLRAASDPEGGVWLGDLAALGTLAHPKPLSPEVLSAATWLSPDQKLQGALRPRNLIEGLRNQLPGGLAKDLPAELEVLFWGATPEEGGKSWRMEISVGGTPDSINKVAPWLQRFGAALDATRSQNQAPIQLLQERSRVGLRASVNGPQLEAALERLGVPSLKIKEGVVQ